MKGIPPFANWKGKNNILIDNRGQPRICDFGLSQIINELAGSGSMTSTPHIGTPRYAAYEIILPKESQSAFAPTRASDTFSLGSVIYEVSIFET
jgi:serine/threonine protein kinase